MSAHTPEPWLVCYDGRIDSHDGELVCAFSWSSYKEFTEEGANATRIVACVNACAGMSDPAAQIQGLYVARETLATVAAEREALRAERDALREALQAMVCMSDKGSQPRKFDEALSWRENDLKARALADAALARSQS